MSIDVQISEKQRVAVSCRNVEYTLRLNCMPQTLNRFWISHVKTLCRFFFFFFLIKISVCHMRCCILSAISHFSLCLLWGKEKGEIIGCHLEQCYATYLVVYLFNSFIFYLLYQLSDVKAMSWRNRHVLIMARHIWRVESENERASWTMAWAWTMKWLILISAFFSLGNNQLTDFRFPCSLLPSICVYLSLHRDSMG